MNLLNILTMLSFVALNVDIIFQTKRIYKTKSSHDISLLGLGIRYGAIMIILIKYISLDDTTLFVGQACIAVTFTVYFFLAVSYFRHKR